MMRSNPISFLSGNPDQRIGLIWLSLLNILIWAMTLTSCRYITQVFAVLVSLLCLWSILSRARGIFACRTCAAVAWAVSLLSPIDVAVRRATDISVSFVEVIQVHHQGDVLRQMAASNKLEGRDFLLYHCSAQFVSVRRAILFRAPLP